MSTIYLLKDPDGTPQYIGVTKRLWKLRITHPSHWLDIKSKTYEWVKKLHKQGLKPIIQKVYDVPAGEAYHTREMLVKHYYNKGIKLTNADQTEVNCRRSTTQKLKCAN